MPTESATPGKSCWNCRMAPMHEGHEAPVASKRTETSHGGAQGGRLRRVFRLDVALEAGVLAESAAQGRERLELATEAPVHPLAAREVPRDEPVGRAHGFVAQEAALEDKRTAKAFQCSRLHSIIHHERELNETVHDTPRRWPLPRRARAAARLAVGGLSAVLPAVGAALLRTRPAAARDAAFQAPPLDATLDARPGPAAEVGRDLPHPDRGQQPPATPQAETVQPHVLEHLPVASLVAPVGYLQQRVREQGQARLEKPLEGVPAG
eukprot:CAMPEP_0179222774 /NCGR_PEP_ID=MMETSP0797-20121207/6891_1 /TAXON_ID=47934 /ORGANISM="Dinophysis acuminata, Strain DAEP01" /LENGTH=265 /DNA_ID=CAMNT_0020929621 /DNA_START=18 /DNA_END=812 /DNA_ORIENTATION=-